MAIIITGTIGITGITAIIGIIATTIIIVTIADGVGAFPGAFPVGISWRSAMELKTNRRPEGRLFCMGCSYVRCRKMLPLNSSS
jgi:hypothetical protein